MAKMTLTYLLAAQLAFTTFAKSACDQTSAAMCSSGAIVPGCTTLSQCFKDSGCCDFEEDGNSIKSAIEQLCAAVPGVNMCQSGNCSETNYGMCNVTTCAKVNGTDAGKVWTSGWNVHHEKCQMCGGPKFETAGCIDNTTCMAVKEELAKMHSPSSTVEPMYRVLGGAMIYFQSTTGCMLCDPNHLDQCNEEHCKLLKEAGATFTFKLPTPGCQKCGNGASGGCQTKEACEAAKDKQNYSYSWNGGYCQDCSPDNPWACSAESCIKLPNMSWGNVSQQCRPCTPTNPSGCSSKSMCEAQTHDWVQSLLDLQAGRAGTCNMCSATSLHTCSEKKCGTVKMPEGVTAAWIRMGASDGSCYTCGDHQTGGCVSKETCEKVKDYSDNFAVWSPNAEASTGGYCNFCTQDSYHSCPEASCSKLTNRSWVADVRGCRACGKDGVDGCKTKETCEASKESEWSENPGVWTMTASGEYKCGVCTQYSMTGCNKETCEKLKIDNDQMTGEEQKASWNEDRMTCGVCGQYGNYGDCSKEACAAAKIPEGEKYELAWNTRTNSCGKCGGCEFGCGTKDSCTKSATSCDQLKKHNATVVWKEAESRCGVCQKESMYDCPADQCTKMGGDWVTNQNRCGKCSTEDTGACITKATCEALKFEGEMERAGVAVFKDGECKMCGSYSLEGCATKETCEANKKYLTDPKATISFKCNTKCVVCGQGSTEGCDTKEKCATMEKTAWNAAKLECKRECSTDDSDGCTKDECSKLKDSRKTFNWLAGMEKCAVCGDGQAEGCTKDTCAKTEISWGKAVWSEAAGRCGYCGFYSIDHCDTKATCEAITMRGGGKAEWKNGVCYPECHKDSLSRCLTKEACNGLGNADIKWDDTKAVCTFCTEMGMGEKTCLAKKTCLSQKEATQAHCKQTQQVAECAAHCKGRDAWCWEMLGLGTDPSAPTVTTAPAAAVTTTTFDVKVAVEDASKFDKAAYTAKLATEMGVKAGEVEISKTEFEVKVGFKFSSDKAITVADATKAIAAAWGIAENLVTVTIDARRLLDGARRLAVDTKVTASTKTTDAAAADKVKTAAKTSAGVTEQLKKVANVVAVTTVEKAPTMEVKVTTKVKAAKAVVKPDTAKLDTIAKAAGGTGATLDASSWKEVKTTTDVSASGAKQALIMVAAMAVFSRFLA